MAKVRTAIKEYCESEHQFEFDPRAPAVRLHDPTFGVDDIAAAVECLLTTRVTLSEKVKKFEQEFSQKFGWSDGVMVNSGSSANLLAIASLVNPEAEASLKPGDEVIVPALSWSTSVWPIIQCGLVPVVVDIDPCTFNIDPNEIERAIGPRTRAVLIIPVYGNPCDMCAIMDICQRHNLVLIEDCCEALGAFYDGVPVGRFGRVSTFSFYYSHHITTLEGGICVTEDRPLAELMRILRAHGWVREVQNPEPYYQRYPDIDPRFLFVNLGYNLRPTELAGAMGSTQLPKLSGFVDTRRENAEWFRDSLDDLREYFSFQEETPKGRSSWFGFPIQVKKGASFKLKDLTSTLNTASIETRPIICGNIARQPAMQLFDYRVSGDLKHADGVMESAFSFGNHQGIGSSAREYIVEQIRDFVRSCG